MPVRYECDICCKIFNHKGTYDRHLQRLKPCNPFKSICNPLLPKMDEEVSEDQCSCCFKTFSSKNNRLKHEKTSKCFYKKITSKEYCDHEKIKELEKAIKELEQKNASIITNNTTNNNNTNNNTIFNNTFILSIYKKEDTSYITDKEKVLNITRMFTSVSNMILMKHFNPEHPENCNVYISSIKSPYAIIYDGINWVINDKKMIINELYEDNMAEVINDFKQLKDSLSKDVARKFQEFLENEKEDDELKDSFKEEVGRILYNHRKQAMDVRKITESPNYKLQNIIENK
jgi:hypothetical protein